MRLRQLFLVGVCLLACSRVATSQVIGVGSECHQADVHEALTRVRARFPAIEPVLRDLEEAKYECRVFRKTTGSATIHTEGDHVMIGWPGGAGRYPDESCMDADARLVHEIHHCWVRSKNDGAEACEFVATRTVSGALAWARASCEFEAVRFENRYRQAAGICERLAYGDFQVPGAERTCAAPETVCRAVTACPAPPRVIETKGPPR
jgi:hypothetical protein